MTDETPQIEVIDKRGKAREPASPANDPWAGVPVHPVTVTAIPDRLDVEVDIAGNDLLTCAKLLLMGAGKLIFRLDHAVTAMKMQQIQEQEQREAEAAAAAESQEPQEPQEPAP